MFCRNYLNRKGSVTISVMLILLAICILNLVLVDYSRSLIYKKDLRQKKQLHENATAFLSSFNNFSENLLARANNRNVIAYTLGLF